ncbi:MAG TPA: mucoidy inhibitor MuiA family protein, partial [Bacteroidales bacterium]|nr:mucoidy inhibitor MuiA family protein [Bacteroidales bacterium]
MKNLVNILPLVMLGLACTITTNSVAADNQKTLPSEISHVTVYPNGAHISRKAGITLSKGESTLVISGLSPYINEQSVQVKGRGNITILSVSSEKNYIANLTEPERLTALRKQLQNVQMNIGDQVMMTGLLKEKESFLLANKVVTGKDQSLDAGNFRTLYDFYSSNMQQVREGLLRTSRSLDSLKEKQKNIQMEINQLQSAQELPAGVIKIVVKANASAEAKFEINYMVSNAGWYPSYDIRVDNPEEPVRLVYKANVYQQTGVEWTHVLLHFSNATPDRSGNVPVLYPWYVDFRSGNTAANGGPYARSARKAANELEEKDVEMDKLNITAPAQLPEASFVGTARTDRATSTDFSIDVPYTIASVSKP